MITLDQLQTFRAIVRARTFTRAADELFLTQPALSQRIRRLEQVLGVKLLLRGSNRRKLCLTPAGERVLHFADRIITLWEHLEHDIKDTSAAKQAEVITIACGATSSRYILPSLLTAYYQRHPDVRVNVIVESTAEKINELVRTGKANLGVQFDGLVSEGLHVVPLVSDRMLLIGPPDTLNLVGVKQRKSRVVKCPFITTPPGTHFRHFLEKWASSLGEEIVLRMETNNSEVVKESVMYGLGLAIVSELAVRDELSDGRLRMVAAPGVPEEYQFCLTYSAEEALPQAARSLLSLASDSSWHALLSKGKRC